MCKGRTQEGKSKCKVRITKKDKTFSAEGFAHLILDYDYVKGDSLSKQCYDRLRKEKNTILATQEYCVCQGRTTPDGEARCNSRVKPSEDDSSCSARDFEKTIQETDSGYKYVEGDLLFSACKPKLEEEKKKLSNKLRKRKQRVKTKGQKEKEEELAKELRKRKKALKRGPALNRVRNQQRDYALRKRKREKLKSNLAPSEKYDISSAVKPTVRQLGDRDTDVDQAMAAGWYMADIDDEDDPREITELTPAQQQRILERFRAEMSNHMRIHTCGVCGNRDFASRPFEETYVSIDKLRNCLLLRPEEAALHRARSPLARSAHHIMELTTESGDTELWRLVDDTQAASIAVLNSSDSKVEEWGAEPKEKRTLYRKTQDLKDRAEHVGKGGWASASEEGLCVFVSTCVRCVKLSSLSIAETKKLKLKIPADLGRLRGVRVPDDWPFFGGNWLNCLPLFVLLLLLLS